MVRPGGPSRSRSGSEAKIDTIDRFERSLDIQISTIESVDEKAATLIRFIGILLGVVIAGLRLIWDDLPPVTWDAGAWLLPLAVGIVALFTSLAFAIMTYLSSNYIYGMRADVAEYFADRNDVEVDEYAEIVLHGYTEIIESNEPIVQSNGRRLKKSLVSLLLGLIALTVSGVFVTLELDGAAEYILLFFSSILAWSVAVYLLDEEFKQSTEEIPSDERI